MTARTGDPRVLVHQALKKAPGPRRPGTLAGKLGLAIPTVRRTLFNLQGGGYVQRDTTVITHAEDPRYRIRQRMGRVPAVLQELCRGREWTTAVEVAQEARVTREAAVEVLEGLQAQGEAHSKRVGHLLLWRHGKAS